MKATKLVTAFGLTAIAMAVSTSSHAVDLVKSDDLTFNLNGDIDLKFIQTTEGSDPSETTLETNFDDIDFDFKMKIDDSLSFLASADLTVESNDGESAESASTFAGFKYNDVTVTAGYREDAIDPLGIDTFEIASLGRASGEQDGSGTVFGQTVVVEYDHDDFEIVASHTQIADTTTVQRSALYGKTKVGDFQIEAGVGKETDEDDTATVNFWQAQVEYFTGPFTLGALYSSMSAEESGTDYDSTGLEFNVNYEVSDKLDVFAGYETIDSGVSGADEYVGMGIGASYAFSKLVKLYVEASTEDGTYLKAKGTGVSTSTKDDVQLLGLLLSIDF